MPKAKKLDETTLLAGRLLDDLRARRPRGAGEYPPTLRQLAESCGVEPDDPRLLQAVAKKAFTDHASAKATGKVELDLDVYLEGDVPSKEELERRKLAELAGRMLRVLESQRQLGPDAYPPTLARLAELCGLKRSDKTVFFNAIAREPMASQAILANGIKPAWDAPVFLDRELQGGVSEFGPALLDFSFNTSRTEKLLGFTPAVLAKKLHQSLRKPFQLDLEARVQRRDLPPAYAWLASSPPCIFLAEDIQRTPPDLSNESDAFEDHRPSLTAGPRDFFHAFREAFEDLKGQNRGANHVRLLDLRHELADFDRESFDAGLRRLREGREFYLTRHEGLLGPLSPEEREACLAENGSLMAFVSRR